MSEIKWSNLTTKQQEGLKRVADGQDIPADLWRKLNDEGLVDAAYGVGIVVDIITPQGRELLAQAETAKAGAGEEVELFFATSQEARFYNELAALRADNDRLRRELEAATAALKTAHDHLETVWDTQDASQVTHDYSYITETLNFVDAALTDGLAGVNHE